MAENEVTTNRKENKLQVPPAEAINPGSMESGSINEEKQTQEERESSRSSREGRYWGDSQTEILVGMEQIQPLGDILTSVITKMTDYYQEKGYVPFDFDYDYTSLPRLGLLLQEKAATIKSLVEEEL